MCLQQTNLQGSEGLTEFAIKRQIELEKDIRKEQILNQNRLETYWKKLEMREHRQEVRDASYTSLYIGDEGYLEIEKANALVDMPQRRVSNFRFGIIFNLISSEGEGGIYGLQIIMNRKDEYIFLDAEKVGKPDYFLKKITAKGGQILVDKRVQRENILIRFWAKLYDLCQETIVIPTHRGWMKKQNDEYQFVKEGELLWEEVLRKAK